MGVKWNPLAAEEPVVAALSTAALLIDAGLIAALAYYGASRIGWRSEAVESRLKPFLARRFRELSLLLVSVATAGSLYMSNILEWTPCRLCWFQRIFMYPLVLIFGISLLFDKNDVKDYALPLAMIGFAIAFVHALIQRFEQFQSAGCSVTAVSCSTTYTFWYGYITISVLAATAFAAVLVLNWKFSGS